MANQDSQLGARHPSSADLSSQRETNGEFRPDDISGGGVVGQTGDPQGISGGGMGEGMAGTAAAAVPGADEAEGGLAEDADDDAGDPSSR